MDVASNLTCGRCCVEQRFFFKSQLIAGKVQVKGKKIKDYAWVSKAELSEYLDPSETEYMKKLLMD
jgi:large subunit ribosomal protein L46